jgi:hypothetical protein
MKRVACWFLFALAAVAMPQPAKAQLKADINQLFIFGNGADPLFLAGTADPSNPASIRAHGEHFIPSAVSGNGTLIAFLESAIGSNVTNLPIGSTSGGQTYQFVGGVPQPTSTSQGPVFAERAQTLGTGRVLAGVSVNSFHFKSVRGVDLHNVELNFTHENVTDSVFPGCDSIVGGDCSQMGVPTLENDFIQFNLNLDLNVTSYVFALSYGLRDWLDVGVAVPVITTWLSGTSNAQVVPFGGPTAVHFFGGTPTDPVLTASRSVQGSATGLGDVSARAKIRLARGEHSAFALLGDVRFATGSEADLLGSGYTTVRGLAIISAQFGNFAPHANVGYEHHTGGDLNDAVLATVGFENAMAPWATLAVDVIGQLQAGDSKLVIPAPVQITVPFNRTITPTNIPNMRDDIINGSFGIKLRAAPGLQLVANGLFPLNRGGLRPEVAWSTGLEYNF